MRNVNQPRKFTLIELIVVLAIIAILVTPAIWVVQGLGDTEHNIYYQEGYDAARIGIPAEACPYSSYRHTYRFEMMKHEQWMRGWQKGFKELHNKGG